VQYRATDAALQDALFLLDEALERGLVEVSVFLKVSNKANRLGILDDIIYGRKSEDWQRSSTSVVA
jgi:hypothetical protein